MLEQVGFFAVEVTARFECFRGTSKERVARKYGVRGVNLLARKAPLPEATYKNAREAAKALGM